MGTVPAQAQAPCTVHSFARSRTILAEGRAKTGNVDDGCFTVSRLAATATYRGVRNEIVSKKHWLRVSKNMPVGIQDLFLLVDLRHY